MLLEHEWTAEDESWPRRYRTNGEDLQASVSTAEDEWLNLPRWEGIAEEVRRLADLARARYPAKGELPEVGQMVAAQGAVGIGGRREIWVYHEVLEHLFRNFVICWWPCPAATESKP